QWPVWVDSSLMLTNMLQGRVTPEVFLFNTQGKLVYQGAIDNWMTDLGKKKPKANQHYLQQALEATVKGLPVKQPFQKAAGCRINDY
ncbi:MAG TPA: hypothetical protein PKD90_18930, partial [Phnomibacter sp.]|nr:hypothetical protein [Phnomibacter sp.]